MGKFIDALGAAAGGGIPGAIWGIGLQGMNDARQLRQQEELQLLQEAGNKRMMDYSQQKQYEMWLKTNYGAQVEQLKKAGLNPGLLYGMSGGGGVTTGGAGGGVTGGTAPTGGREMQDMMGLGMQMALLKAQKENIEASTEKTKADTEKTQGVDTGLVRTQILDLTVGIDNKRAEKLLTEVQTRLAGLDEQLKTKTIEDQIRAIGWTAAKIMEEMDTAKYTTQIAEHTWRDKVELVQAELLGTWLRNALTAAQTDKTRKDIQVADQQIKNMAMKIAQDWRALEISGQGANTAEAKQKHDEWVQDVQSSTQLPVDVIEKGIQAIILRNIMNRPEHTPIKGFGK